MLKSNLLEIAEQFLFPTCMVEWRAFLFPPRSFCSFGQISEELSVGQMVKLGQQAGRAARLLGFLAERGFLPQLLRLRSHVNGAVT